MSDIIGKFIVQGPEEQVNALAEAFRVVNICCRIGTCLKVSLVVDGDGTSRFSIQNETGEELRREKWELPEKEEFKFYIGE